MHAVSAPIEGLNSEPDIELTAVTAMIVNSTIERQVQLLNKICLILITYLLDLSDGILFGRPYYVKIMVTNK